MERGNKPKEIQKWEIVHDAYSSINFKLETTAIRIATNIMVKRVALNCTKESPTSFQQLELAFSLSISIWKIKKRNKQIDYLSLVS